MNASLLPNIQQLTIVFRDFEGLEQWGAYIDRYSEMG
jgi:hypothetical protein